MNDLTEFLLTSNQLEGDVAPELYSLKRLQRFEVERNNLSGSLRPSIANWQEMEIIYLNHNAMTGTLPAELGTLVNLRKATFTRKQVLRSHSSRIGQSCQSRYVASRRIVCKK